MEVNMDWTPQFQGTLESTLVAESPPPIPQKKMDWQENSAPNAFGLHHHERYGVEPNISIESEAPALPPKPTNMFVMRTIYLLFNYSSYSNNLCRCAILTGTPARPPKPPKHIDNV